MKKILCSIILVFLSALCAMAGEVTLVWDANEPMPDGYRLFQRVSGAEFDYSAPAWEGAETSTTLVVQDGTTYSWVVRAFVGGVESADSNEVTYTSEPDPDPVIIPARPKRLILEFND